MRRQPVPILCRIGCHTWEYSPAVYENETHEALALAQKRATRHCTKCPAAQQRDVICLGLNPPKYLRNWKKDNDKESQENE